MPTIIDSNTQEPSLTGLFTNIATNLFGRRNRPLAAGSPTPEMLDDWRRETLQRHAGYLQDYRNMYGDQPATASGVEDLR